MAKLFLAFARTGLITGAVILLFVLSAPLLRKKYTARLRRAVWLLLAVLVVLWGIGATLFRCKLRPVEEM